MQLVTRGVAAALAVSAVMLLTGCSDAWSRSQLDLRGFTSDHYDYEGSHLYSVDVTETVCGPVAECEQAVRSRYFTWLKFPTLIEAECYADQLGERGVQVDPFVIDFDGEPVTSEERREIVEAVSGFYASSPD